MKLKLKDFKKHIEENEGPFYTKETHDLGSGPKTWYQRTWKTGELRKGKQLFNSISFNEECSYIHYFAIPSTSHNVHDGIKGVEYCTKEEYEQKAKIISERLDQFEGSLINEYRLDARLPSPEYRTPIYAPALTQEQVAFLRALL